MVWHIRLMAQEFRLRVSEKHELMTAKNNIAANLDVDC